MLKEVFKLKDLEVDLSSEQEFSKWIIRNERKLFALEYTYIYTIA